MTVLDRAQVYAFITAEKATYGVRRLCRVLGVGKSGYYAWVDRKGAPTAAELAEAYDAETTHTAWVEHTRPAKGGQISTGVDSRLAGRRGTSIPRSTAWRS